MAERHGVYTLEGASVSDKNRLRAAAQYVRARYLSKPDIYEP